MAIGSSKATNVRVGYAQPTATVTPKGTWIVANSDTRTAQTAGMVLSPATITDASFAWVKVPEQVTKVLVRGRVPIATTSIGTAPVVKVLGAYTNGGDIASDGSFANDGTILFQRLDNASPTAAGVTVGSVATLSGSFQKDAVYYYMDLTTLTGYNILGADYVGVAVTTASSTTATAAIEIQVLFL